MIKFITASIATTLSITAAAQRQLTIQLPDSTADVCLTVRDAAFADDEAETSLRAGLLLNGELRGSVEDPQWYFTQDSAARQRRVALDALMLTQGWSRYDVPKTLTRQFTHPEGFLEVNSEVRGVVKSRWKGKPVADGYVAFIAPDKAWGNGYPTDSEGIFAMDDYDFPDGTTFIVQAQNKKGDIEANMEIEEQKFPSVNPLLPEYDGQLGGLASNLTSPVTDYTWRLTHSNGMMNILLGNVEVIASPKGKTQEEIFEMLGAPKSDYQDFEKAKTTTYEQAVRVFPGLRVNNGTLYYGRDEVEIWVDGTRWERPDIVTHIDFHPTNTWNTSRGDNGSYLKTNILNELEKSIPFHDVKSLQYYRPYLSMIFSRTAAERGGVLLVTTKDGTEIGTSRNWLLQTITPLGYQSRREFYTPKYELLDDAEINTRPTLYWMPRVKPDKSGHVTLTLPGSVDRPTVVVEGVTPTGRLISEKITAK